MPDASQNPQRSRRSPAGEVPMPSIGADPFGNQSSIINTQLSYPSYHNNTFTPSCLSGYNQKTQNKPNSCCRSRTARTQHDIRHPKSDIRNMKNKPNSRAAQITAKLLRTNTYERKQRSPTSKNKPNQTQPHKHRASSIQYQASSIPPIFSKHLSLHSQRSGWSKPKKAQNKANFKIGKKQTQVLAI